MWEEKETGTLFWEDVRLIETDLDNQESLDCILDAESRKSARFFVYSGSYDICLLIYNNQTFEHKVIKLATSDIYSVEDICADIISKIREVVDGDGSVDFQICMQPWVNSDIVDWLTNVNNVWEYCADHEILMDGESVQCYCRVE